MNIEEVSFFLYELNRLMLDYQKCSDKKIRREILEDIHLLKHALHYYC
ncbi:hypothetical protein [Heyndrickxia acidicola]|uniref:Uncharacterized protein n=1 Tax=Heyndrickxia acidicola TaxID=209389 RepID=A0ABU6MBR5_9BACI|nr:hypothetical protein [Heyndrickxia acidicola]MED1201864.1 hypothetical protein [Heyndrickxia acidicola]